MRNIQIALILLSVVLCFWLSVCWYCHAAAVDINTAQIVAQKFFSDATGKLSEPISINTETGGDRQPVWYVFNFDNGFVIVSAEDNVRPIIGYSTDNRFDFETRPPQLQEMLKRYAAYIDAFRATPTEASDEIRRQWARLKSPPSDISLKIRERAAFYLIQTSWGQGTPYNAQCPEDPDGPGGHVQVGCVALSMGQILNYWSFPAHGLGTHTYTHEVYGDLTADFGNTNYRWDGTSDSISLLLFHCGVAVNMQYSPINSLAYTEDAMKAFTTYFGYSESIRYVQKDDTALFPDDAAWISMLRKEIDEGRPVIYGGMGFVGAHAFNVDGYDDQGYFHLNFGWGGTSNGFYPINHFLLYNHHQEAIVGIQPAPVTAHFIPDAARGTIPFTVTFTDDSLSKDSARPITSWVWDFGDGNTSSDRHPTHTYEKPGLYTVTLTVSNGSEQDVFERPNHINALSPHPVIYVAPYGSDETGDGTEANPYASIQYGMDAAADTVLVVPGVYRELIDFKGKNIKVQSLFALTADRRYIALTILDGTQKGSVVTFKNGETSAELNGFTITGGQSNSSEYGGGGVMCLNGATPKLRYLMISDNSAVFGGGVCCLQSAPVLEQVEIFGNSASVFGAGIYCSNADVGFNHVRILDNVAQHSGGGLYSYQSKPTLKDVTVSGNSAIDGGGMYFLYSGGTIANTVIIDNTADTGAGIYGKYFNAEMTSTDISGNSGKYGAGIWLSDSNPNLTDCSMTRNTAAIAGGGLYATTSEPILTDVTISGNSAAKGGGFYGSSAQPKFSTDRRCDIMFNWAIEGSEVYSETTLQIVVDAFTVKTPTSWYASPLDKMTFNILRGLRPQINGNVYVSPAGDNANSGISDQEALKSVSYAAQIIQADAEHPRTIFLSAGTYTPDATGERFPILVPNHVSIQGSGPDRTVLDAAGQASVLYFKAVTQSTISNMTISNGFARTGSGGGIYCEQSSPNLEWVILNANQAAAYGGGLYCASSSPTLSHITLIRNSAVQGAGIYLTNSHPTMSDLLISDNMASNRGGGMFCMYNSKPKLIHATISGNSAAIGGGVYAIESSPFLEQVLITDNVAEQAGAGMYGYGASLNLSNVAITQNVSEGDGGGVCCESGTLTLRSVTIYENQANNGGGIYISNAFLEFDDTLRPSIYSNTAVCGRDLYAAGASIAASKISIVLDRFTVKNPTDVYAFPSEQFTFDILNAVVKQVDSDVWVSPDGDDRNSGVSPEQPFKTIGHALSVTAVNPLHPRVIFLGPGVYSPQTNGERFPLYLINDVSLKGAGKTQTILDAEGQSRVLWFSEVSRSQIEGLTLTNGVADFGGGIYCYKSDPIFKEMLLSQHTASESGGGVYCGQNSAPVFNDVSFFGNSAFNSGGGVYCDTNSTAVFEDVQITGNSAVNGGGLFGYNSSMRIQYSLISQNSATYGGGVFCYGTNVGLESVRISGNSASDSGGGLYAKQSVLNLTNMLADQNQAFRFGGGVCIDGGSLDMRHVTVADNAAQTKGGGAYIGNGCRVRAISTILWNNSSQQIAFSDFGSANSFTAAYSNIQGGLAGIERSQTDEVIESEGNMDSDPLFSNPAIGDYHLSSQSPCIDNGNSMENLEFGMKNLTSDLDGDFRPYGSAPDIGADEYITGNHLIVHQPNGGEIWEQGADAEIRWSAGELTGNQVRIDIMRNEEIIPLYQFQSLNSRRLVWRIPSDFPPADNYKIRITSLSDEAIYDDSNGCFSVAPMLINQLALKMDDLETPVSSGADMPVIVQNPNKIPLKEIQIRIAYQPNIVKISEITLTRGFLEKADYQFQADNSLDGQVILKFSARSTPLTGEGIIARLRLEGFSSSSVGTRIFLTAAEAQINQTTVPARSGSVNVLSTAYTISGNIVEAFERYPVPNVVLTITEAGQTQKRTCKTDLLGDYRFPNLSPNAYTLTLLKTDDPAALRDTDALTILNWAAQAGKPDCYNLAAGDVTGNGRITATDAAMVRRYAAGLIPCLNAACSFWAFLSKNGDPTADSCASSNLLVYAPLNSDRLNEDFLAVRLGKMRNREVGINYPTAPSVSHSLSSMPRSSFSMPPSSFLILPIRLTQEMRIDGLDIAVTYDPNQFDVVGITLFGGILADRFYQMKTTVLADGRVLAAIAAGADLFRGAGNAVFLIMNVKASLGSSSAITLTRLDCNESPVSGGFAVNGSSFAAIDLMVRPLNLSDAIQGLNMLAGVFPDSACSWMDINSNSVMDMADVLGLLVSLSLPES